MLEVTHSFSTAYLLFEELLVDVANMQHTTSGLNAAEVMYIFHYKRVNAFSAHTKNISIPQFV